MKLPRDLSGNEVAKLLAHHYGYRVARTKGSHMMLTLTVAGTGMCRSGRWTPSSPASQHSSISPSVKYSKRSLTDKWPPRRMGQARRTNPPPPLNV